MRYLALLVAVFIALVGVERVRAILDWEATQGTGLVRAGSVLAVALGGFLACAVCPPRRTV